MDLNKYQAWSKQRIEERSPKESPRNFLFTAIVIGAGSDPKRAIDSLNSLAQQSYQNIEIIPLDTDHIDGLDVEAFDLLRGLRFEPNVSPQDLLNLEVHDDLWRGDYISFIRVGTTFDRDCFSLINSSLSQDTSGGADLVIVDHDYTDPISSHVTPVFLPFWDPDLVGSSNIIDLAFVASRRLVSSTRALQECTSCHDWIQSIADKKVQPSVAHVSEPVMHMMGSAPQIAKWEPVSPLPWHTLDANKWPSVAIVIPDHQTLAELKQCTRFLEQPCKFRPELIIVGTQSKDPETQGFYAELTARFGAKIVAPGPVLNHARRVNRGVAAAHSDIIMLLWASVCFMVPDQIEQLVLQAMRPQIGVVGTTLRRKDGSIHQAGIVVTEADNAELDIGDGLKGADPDQQNAFFPINAIRNYQAVSGACQVMRRDVFERVSGYDEIKFPFDFCGVDFCLRVHQTGFRILNMPLSQVHQLNTATRPNRKAIPSDDHMQKQAMSSLKERWHTSTKCNAFCNPWIKIVNRSTPTPPWVSEQEEQTANSKDTTIPSKTKKKSEGITYLRWVIRHPRKAVVRALGLPETWHISTLGSSCDSKDDIPHLQPGLGAYGYFLSEIGLGQSARNLVNAADKAGLPISALNVPLTADRQNDQEFRTKLKPSHGHAANMLILDVLGTRKAKDLLAPGRFNILYPYWELSAVPSNCIDSIALFDEIWAPSSFIANAMEKDFSGSVQLVPQSVKLPDTMPLPRENRSTLRVFTFFDFDSFGARKNPQAAISAFQMAFPHSCSDVELVVKARGKNDRGLRRWIASIVRKDKRIRFIDSTLSRKAVDQLMADCDVFISLHRSEGFGFGAAEALAAGKAVVATDYGGTTDFITEATGYPVPFQLQTVKKGEYVEPDGQVWADASLEAAAAALRSIYDNSTEAASRTESGFNLLKTNHSPEQVGAVMKKLLAQRGLV